MDVGERPLVTDAALVLGEVGAGDVGRPLANPHLVVEAPGLAVEAEGVGLSRCVPAARFPRVTSKGDGKYAKSSPRGTQKERGGGDQRKLPPWRVRNLTARSAPAGRA